MIDVGVSPDGWMEEIDGACLRSERDSVCAFQVVGAGLGRLGKFGHGANGLSFVWLCEQCFFVFTCPLFSEVVVVTFVRVHIRRVLHSNSEDGKNHAGNRSFDPHCFPRFLQQKFLNCNNNEQAKS